ncbi:uncharacterized protein LOC108671545 [Hyalella azteca]|uniref:Uncharacterized protein LOC108671545 n=1 Tax=Hyalella azteca TaxID=294128 RepID=A0A8B7NN27_HYAAZ|nr:uncharacterized protein LOC108671545 [Hyalella azteca]
MKLTALIVLCLTAVTLAVPVPQNRYIIRRPQNSVNLHSAARQLSSNAGQTFTVKLDDDNFDSRENVLSLQGVGNFATSQAGVASTAARTAQQPTVQHVSVGGNAQFRVQVDDDGFDSHESDEILLTTAPCPAGQLRHGTRCVIPKINRNIFVFGRNDEEPEPKSIDPAIIPEPQLDYNIIFVRSRPAKAQRPHIVPPPQKKTVVYVLEDESAESGVISAPVFPDADPEVYYVKVKEGENPQLPGGLDLETAYSQAIRPLKGDDSFESSVELTLGPAHGAGNVGVPLSATQPQATFNGAAGFDAGQSQSNFNGAAGFDAGQSQSNFNGAGGFDAGQSQSNFNGAGGFDAAQSQSNFNGAAGFDAAQPEATANGFGAVGVPLPSFQGNADFANGGAQGRSTFSSRGTRFAAGSRNFEVEVDDGRVEIEAKSEEAVRPALRYAVPQLG